MQKVPQFFSAYNTSYMAKHIMPNKIKLQIHLIFATNEKKKIAPIYSSVRLIKHWYKV